MYWRLYQKSTKLKLLLSHNLLDQLFYVFNLVYNEINIYEYINEISIHINQIIVYLIICYEIGKWTTIHHFNELELETWETATG